MKSKRNSAKNNTSGRKKKRKVELDLKELPPFWEKVEHFNSKLIPIALVLLLFVIIYELFVHLENQVLNLIFSLMDYLVILIFVVDIIFLAVRSKNVKFFLKHYWLDILAIFPFSLFFSLAEKFYKAAIASKEIIVSQALAHETIEVRKGILELSKTERLSRYFKIAARSLRVVTKSRFFRKFKHSRNNLNDNKKTKSKNLKKKDKKRIISL